MDVQTLRKMQPFPLLAPIGVPVEDYLLVWDAVSGQLFGYNKECPSA